MLVVGALVLPFGPAVAQAKPSQPVRMDQEASRIRTKVVPPKGQTKVTPKAAPGPGAVSSRAFHGRFKGLQLNLCNGGEAACYQGGLAAGEGHAMINLVDPDAVTLNEICSADLFDRLVESMAYVWPNDYVAAAFMPAQVASGGTYIPYKCRNGDDFGNGVLMHIPVDEYYGFEASGWRYGAQDAGTEKRTAACGYALYHFYLCATHLSARDSAVAMSQCAALTQSIIPQLRAESGFAGPAIIGGDFNLKYPGPPNVQNCVPPGYTRKGDSAVQHFIVSNAIQFVSASRLGMQYTDHPALIAELNRP
ncbi:MAG TPA: endonuclease/exonuclease/phosphatase family protein [Catenuloplanes sp.]|jgi:hypothetical protein